MYLFKSNRNFHYSILYAVCVFVICYIFFNVSYIECDDLEMLKIAKGYYSSSPDEHLVFINVLVGFICKFLYVFTTKIEWYSIIIISLQFVSIAFIFYCLLCFKSKKILFFLVTIAFIYLITNIQFTMVSMLLGLAGLLGLFKIKKGDEYHKYIVPNIFLFFSSLIRIEAFYLVFFIGVIYILTIKTKIWKDVIFLKSTLLLFLFISLSVWVNKLSYSSPDWMTYSKYNQVRGKINDNPNLDNNRKLLFEKKLSIPGIEIDLFNSFVYTSSFDAEKMEKIAGWVSHPAGFKMFMKHLYYWLQYYKYIVFLLILTLFSSRSEFKKNLLPIVGLLVIFLFICYNHLPKERVMLMLFFEVILFHLFLDNFNRPLSYVICFLAVIWMGDNYYKSVNNIYRNCKNDYLQLDHSKTYVPLFPIEYAYPNDIPPFDTKKYTQIKMIASGWLNNSPFQKFQLTKLNLDPTIPISVLDLNIEKNNIAFLGKMNRVNQTNLINTYLSLKDKQLKLVETKSNFCIYSVTHKSQ